MPKFQFLVTRDTTESAVATIEADTIEQAQFLALSAPEGALDFQPDDGSEGDIYLPDPDDWEQLPD